MVDAADSSESSGAVRLHWDRALTWAVCGEDRVGLGTQDRPDLDRLTWELSAGADLPALVAGRRARRQPWPFPVPAELMAGLGPAQFAAALTELRSRLGLDATRPGTQQPVLATRALDPAERRLLDDVPPHHGSV